MLGVAIVGVFVVAFVFYAVHSKHILLARFNHIKGNRAKAMERYGQAYAKRPQVTTGLNYGFLLIQDGQYEPAAKVLGEVAGMASAGSQEQMQARMFLGLLRWKRGELKGAIRDYEKIMESYVTTTVYANLGFLYLQDEDLDKALAFNREAYQYNDTNPVILDNLGDTYLRRGELDAAREIFEKALEGGRTIMENYYHYALVLEQMGECEDALRFCKQALEKEFVTLSGVNREDVKALYQRLSGKVQD